MDAQTQFGCASDDSLAPALCGDVTCFELGHIKVIQKANQNLLLLGSVSVTVVFSVQYAAKTSLASG